MRKKLYTIKRSSVPSEKISKTLFVIVSIWFMVAAVVFPAWTVYETMASDKTDRKYMLYDRMLWKKYKNNIQLTSL